MTTETAQETVKLSYSIAKILLDKTPLHAWSAHRLLGGQKKADTQATIDGRIYEALMFGKEADVIRIVKAANFKTDAAKAARDEILGMGLIPVLQADYPEYAEAAMAMATNMNKDHWITFEEPSHPPEQQKIDLDMFGYWVGTQVTLVWTKDGVECKGVLDRLSLFRDSYIIDDVKCMDDASPHAFGRSVTEYGYDIQHAAYIEAVETLWPHLAGRGDFRFLTFEKKAPFAAVPYHLDGSLQSLGEEKWARAKRIWAPCLATNTWPSYKATRLGAKPWQILAEAEASAAEVQP